MHHCHRSHIKHLHRLRQSYHTSHKQPSLLYLHELRQFFSTFLQGHLLFLCLIFLKNHIYSFFTSLYKIYILQKKNEKFTQYKKEDKKALVFPKISMRQACKIFVTRCLVKRAILQGNIRVCFFYFHNALL